MTKMQEKYPLLYGVQNPALRTVCEPVKSINKEIRDFSVTLLNLMYEYDGVGLAAPQIGKLLRMAAFVQFDMSKDKREIVFEDVMINPIILSASESLDSEEEGCLSLPGVTGYVDRSKSIVVQYTNIYGEKTIRKAKGYNARIILHEIDHLDGVLFVDKLVT